MDVDDDGRSSPSPSSYHMCMRRRYRICCQVMSNGDSEEDDNHDESDDNDNNDGDKDNNEDDSMDDNDDDAAN